MIVAHPIVRIAIAIIKGPAPTALKENKAELDHRGLSRIREKCIGKAAIVSGIPRSLPCKRHSRLSGWGSQRSGCLFDRGQHGVRFDPFLKPYNSRMRWQLAGAAIQRAIDA
jgi:hypothetical protein